MKEEVGRKTVFLQATGLGLFTAHGERSVSAVEANISFTMEQTSYNRLGNKLRCIEKPGNKNLHFYFGSNDSSL